MSTIPVPDHYTGSTIAIPASYREALAIIFTTPGPLAAVAVVIAGMALRLWLGYWQVLDVLFMAIIIGGWCFIEWMLHNYLLHANPLPLLKLRLPSIMSRMHAEHHRDPWEYKTLFFKWPTIIALWLLPALLCWLLFPPGPAVTAATSFILMLERYEWIHLIVHSKIQPRSAYMQKVTRTHLNHHFKNSSKWMGVSTWLADEVFRTDR